VSISRNATVEMETTPASPAVAGTVVVPLWPLNLSALKIRRFVNWRMARANSVLFSNVNYS